MVITKSMLAAPIIAALLLGACNKEMEYKSPQTEAYGSLAAMTTACTEKGGTVSETVPDSGFTGRDGSDGVKHYACRDADGNALFYGAY